MILSYDKVWSQISSHKIYLNCGYVTHYACFYVMRAVKVFILLNLSVDHSS